MTGWFKSTQQHKPQPLWHPAAPSAPAPSSTSGCGTSNTARHYPPVSTASRARSSSPSASALRACSTHNTQTQTHTDSSSKRVGHHTNAVTALVTQSWPAGSSTPTPFQACPIVGLGPPPEWHALLNTCGSAHLFHNSCQTHQVPAVVCDTDSLVLTARAGTSSVRHAWVRTPGHCASATRTCLTDGQPLA